MRTSDTPLEPDLRKEIENLLPQLMADLRSAKDAETFLRSFLSEKEVEVFSKRLAIIYWLKKGKSYQQIKNDIKVSSATIASVHDTLEKPGIELALKILEANEWASRMSDRIKKIVGK